MEHLLKAVGCPIAMGNAMEHVKEVAKVIVADHDHDECAEAIYNYLLQKRILKDISHLRVPEDNLTSGGVFVSLLIVHILNH